MTSVDDLPLRTTSDQPESTSAIVSESPTLLELLPSWELALRASALSDGTVLSYKRTIRTLNAWMIEDCRPVGIDQVTTEDLRAWLAHRIESTSAGNAAKDRRNLSVFWNWIEEENERAEPNPMRRLDRIKVSPSAAEIFTDDELRALLKTCNGTDFESRRDLAIMRIFMDNGMRCSGMAGIRYTPNDDETNDVKLTGRARLRITLKGGRQIWVPIGMKAAAAVDRYIRTRRRHKQASSEWLWLPNRAIFNSEGECKLSASGIAQMLDRRGEEAGVHHVHPHKFRRTMATTWEGDPLELMDIGGWESLEMVRLYQRAGREERAHVAHRKHSPGDRI